MASSAVRGRERLLARRQLAPGVLHEPGGAGCGDAVELLRLELDRRAERVYQRAALDEARRVAALRLADPDLRQEVDGHSAVDLRTSGDVEDLLVVAAAL